MAIAVKVTPVIQPDAHNLNINNVFHLLAIIFPLCAIHTLITLKLMTLLTHKKKTDLHVIPQKSYPNSL